jgi:hypothetical protein
MTTPAIGATTLHPTAPFVTTSMFRQEPTGVALDNLVAGGTPQQQEAKLSDEIMRASSDMNVFCYGASGGVLTATTDTEAMRLPVDRVGYFRLTPRFTPVRALTAFSWGVDAASMTAVTDLSHVEVELGRIGVPAYPFTGMSSAGPLQFGAPAAYGSTLWTQFSYVNGWPRTTLTAAAAQGAQSITVADATGIFAGLTQLTIRDPVGGTETFTATSVNGNTIGCPPLAYGHTPGSGTAGVIQVDGLPEALITACVEITTGLLKRRAQDAVRGPAKGKQVSDTAAGEDNFSVGYEMLHDFIQVRAR